MKKLLTTLLFLLFFLSWTSAQHQYDRWCFGTNAGLDFSSGSPVAVRSAIAAAEGCSSIADATTGKLLFYTDGRTVYNADDEVMSNGIGLMADASSTQAALIVKAPGANKLFYIFTASPDLYYSVVDMSLNKGQGEVTTKNVILTSAVTEKLTAGMHGNGKDIWVIARTKHDQFVSWLVTTSGVSKTPVTSSGGKKGSYSNEIGQMKMNEQDSQLVITSYIPELSIFGFNNSTGQLTYRYSLDAAANTYGAGFSPNGQFLYTMRQVPGKGYDISQYDLKAGDSTKVVGSKFAVAHGESCWGGFQIGPDNKMYLPDQGKSSVSVIKNPDVKGDKCNFSQSAIKLVSGTTATLGLPQAFWPGSDVLLMPLPPPY